MPKSKRASTSRVPQALTMLIKDHRKVQKMFKEFDKLEDEPEEKRRLVKEACNELKIHSKLEEAVFYPAIRKGLQEREKETGVLAEADVEHSVIDGLVEKLTRMTNTDDEHFDATFEVLGEYVNHHIKEEEDQLFPAIRRAKIELDDLAEQMRQRKEALMEEMGLGEGDGEEEDTAAYSESKNGEQRKHS